MDDYNDSVPHQDHTATLLIKGLTNDNLIEKEDKEREFTWKESRTKVELTEIKGIIYGGFSSRFWSFRKQINMIDLSTNMDYMWKQIPFYSWECVTI